MQTLKYADPAQFTPFFTRRRGVLYCEQVPVASVARRWGTPAYLYSCASIEAAYRRFERAFADVPHTICYSVKANSNLSILSRLAQLGSAFDIVSGGELYRLRRLKVDGGRIVFSGVGKTRQEMREGLAAKILLFNVESEAELALLSQEAARSGRRARAALRVNPGVEAGAHPHISTGHRHHKFGVDWKDARRLYRSREYARWIDWRGISVHIGSQILSVAPYARAVGRMVRFVHQLARDGVALSYFDCGGGFGVRYANEKPPALAAYANAVMRAVRPLGAHLLLEPGRAIVGLAGVLLTTVLYTKRNQGKRFIVVDAAMNDFVRPSLYGGVHPVTPAVSSARAMKLRRADIVGPVCESGDCFLRDWPIEEVASGDLLVIWGAGAYGFIQASNYNSRLRPAEVLVEGSRFRLIRQRESRADLVRAE